MEKNTDLKRCLDAAVRYLGYRPRSEAEMREKLKRRGFSEDDINKALGKLKRQGLIDDVAFAEFWKDNRESFSPRSPRLTRLELGRKGVPVAIIEQVVGGLDEGDSAYRAAMARAGRMSLADYEVFRRRLGEYLRRRGFGYDVINRTIDQVWRESGAGQPAGIDSDGPEDPDFRQPETKQKGKGD